MKDTLLIEGLKQRDKIVYDYIFNYYYSSLCAFSFSYVKDRGIVEDLVQDFFVSLWINATRIEIKTSLKSYLFTSIKNRCFDYQKHEKVAAKYKAKVLFTASYDDSTENYFAESELRQVIEKCIEKLSDRCREIFELSRIKGLSNEEISKELGISKRTVELQISNSLKILRKELIEYFPAIIIGLLLQ